MTIDSPPVSRPASTLPGTDILPFGVAMFLSAILVFALEPMIAKMVLPQLGGSPAVWNTAMMFFQIALLGGYAYAHLLQRLAPLKIQIILHTFILAVSLLVLPVGVSTALGPPPIGNPVWWLLGVLLVSIGAPFAALSATAPLMQAWYVRRQHKAATPRNPYVLYAASNLGSLLALLAYPLLIEPNLTLPYQSRLWTSGYQLFLALTIGLGVIAWRSNASATQTPATRPHARIPESRRLRWVLLAAAPSSLMLGTTTYIANDIASVPLFWVIPLALYLTTFIISFQAVPVIGPAAALRWQVLFACLSAGVFCISGLSLPLHLLVFLWALFFGALICHQALAADRPEESHLTEFYLLISLGGVCGGVFNSLLAPIIFHDVFEFPLMLVLICLARPWSGKASFRDIAICVAGIAMVAGIALLPQDLHGAAQITLALIIGSCIAAALVSRRAGLFTLVIAALCGQAALIAPARNPGLLTIRSFFGVSRLVTMTEPQLGGAVHVLYHGTTIHGSQPLAPAQSCNPGTYYARAAPIGKTIAALQQTHPALTIGVVGLGAGAIAAYTRPTDTIRYFEIDPAVVAIARNPAYFTYLSRCAKGRVDIVQGDARLTLGQQRSGQFDLLILDAFSADNIPTHLLTREAFALYRRAVTSEGIVVLHISNRNLALEAPLAATAKAANLPAKVLTIKTPPELSGLIMASSKIMALSGSATALAQVTQAPGWHAADDRGTRAWTDEYSNIAGAIYAKLVEHQQ